MTYPHAYPAPQGLYDPAHEHDACGVAFVATLTGEASHDIVRKGITALLNLDHRGAAGAETNSGDGAGILIQVPDAFLREVTREAGLRAARAQVVRRRHGVPARRRRARGEDPPPDRGDRPRGEPRGHRVARGPGRPEQPRPDRPRGDAVVRPAVRRGQGQPDHRHGPGAAGVLPAQARRERDRRLLPVAVLAHPDLQGHAHHPPARRGLPGPARRAGGLRARRRALPVLDQHVPELAAEPPVPLHRPQRRDQHGHGQPQLDAGPRGAARLRPGAGRPRPALPDLHHRRVGLRVVRRGARAAAHGRALAAALGADDDPRGVGEPRRDGRPAARVLRVPLVGDGALGRPRLRRVHRRRPGRRGPRPQRPAPQPLLGHRRRARGPGVRGRRPRPRPGHHRAQGPAPARPDVPRRPVRAPDHRGRRDQVRARRRAPLRRVAARRPHPPRRHPGPRAHRAHARVGHPAPAGLRLHRGGAARPAHPDGQLRRRAAGLDGHRHPDRRAERQAAAALRLLRPALRPGHEPAAGRDPGGAGHVALGQHRPRGQPARPDPRVVPPDRAALPGHLQRRPGQDPAHQPRRRHAGLHHARLPRPLRGRGRRRGDGPPPGRDLPGGQRGDRRRRPGHRAVRPALDPGARAHPVAAADGRHPPPPGPREDPHPGRPARRGRRHPRGAPRRAARRLRRRRGQPLPGDGVRRGPRPRGLLRQGRAGEGGRQPDQGARQGRPQGHVQDGRLDGRLLHRRADLRGRRAVPVPRRPLLHRYDVEAGRGRARHDRRGGRSTARVGVPARRHRPGAPRARDRRRVPVAPRGRAAPLRPRDRVPAPALHADRQLRRSSSSTPSASTSSPSG